MAIRLILTVALIYAILRETGPFTAIGFGLIFVTMEVLGWYVKKTTELLKSSLRDFLANAVANLRRKNRTNLDK